MGTLVPCRISLSLAFELSHLEVLERDRVGDLKPPPMGNVARCFGLMQAPLQILWLKKSGTGGLGFRVRRNHHHAKRGRLGG